MLITSLILEMILFVMLPFKAMAGEGFSCLNSKIIEQKINSIIAQKTSNIFYLPASGALEDDYIIRLDELHSMPFSAHRESPDRQKLFTLSNTGFYMLVLKLSVHFCRFQEKINRSSF